MDVAPTLMERWKQGAADEIAGQAIALFLRDGFETTTVEAIATAAGVSRRTFYRYFGCKEDVAFYGLPEAFEQRREIWFTDQDRGFYMIRLTQTSLD